MTSPNNQPVIEISNLVKIFKTPAGEFSALKGVSAGFRQGEFVSVVGKSGSGKSTLVNMITGIDHPTSGSVRVGETIITRMKEGRMAAWRGRNLGIVFQFFQLLPMLTLLENVLLPMDFCNMWGSDEREPRAIELLKMVGLEGLADKMPAELSGGQQQATAVARALANDPPIIIADEPTGNLDSHTAEIVFQIFCDLAARGKTILMVTHDPSLAARTTRSLLLFDGELINEVVARAFPALPHRQMLWLTKSLHPFTLMPGQEIPLDGTAGVGLVLPASAAAQLVLHDRNDGVLSVLPLTVGQAFSPLDRDLAGDTRFSLRAPGDQPLEILTLAPDAFQAWIDQPGPARDIFLSSAQMRAGEISELLLRRSQP